MRLALKLLITIGLFVFTACANKDNEKPKITLFQLLAADRTGIDFVNQLDYTEELNTYTFKNFYNGGGVGLGDFNKDGLLDIFFSGNLVPNKLYLNKGNFHFEDISESAGLNTRGVWTTGVSLVDINADGLLDIYLCKSGPPSNFRRYNELFINNGNLTFTERSKEYGLALEGLSVHAAFFDFDKDGDLDCYLLNNSIRSVGGYDLRKGQRNIPDPLGGNKLLRNDGGKFNDISQQAGIYTSAIGFGLGVTIGDVNKDGWSDIYVSNDFFEKDYLYINNQNGTFSESIEMYMREISLGSMGADMADVNNDGLPEIFVTEMLPEGDDRLKTTTQFENWDKYKRSFEMGYYHQFSRNVLQLNNGDGTFSEIARFSGVHATDWSWGALIFDMDNDGLKDIFVANGIYQDLTNQDYLRYVSNEEVVKSIVSGKTVDYKRLIEAIPSVPIPNFAFKNLGNFNFADRAKEWGMGTPSFSNGSAYGDLDNDGDLDLVINNVNSLASVFRNETDQLLPQNHYLKFELKGVGKNTFAFGTKITVTHKASTFYIEQMPIRGFESSMDPRPNIGLGKIDTVEQILIEWPDGKGHLLVNIPTNQTLHLDQRDGVSLIPKVKKESPVFERSRDSLISFIHVENEFVDFDRDPLIYQMLSSEGPRMSKGDINGDGREDVYIGGAKDQPGALFVQTPGGSFKRTNEMLLEKDKVSEDMASLFFDADGDGDQDLYVCSGGNEFSSSSTALSDRLYMNDGRGNLTKSPQILPVSRFESTSTVKATDYDQDGDLDLFVGVRLLPFSYGMPVNGYILNNDGKGNFQDVSQQIAPGLQNLGMITDAAWADVDGDNDEDLLIVGEYMPVKVFINEAGKFIDQTVQSGLGKSNGWWNRLEAADMDKDGDIDFVIGNHGKNSRFRASVNKPVRMYVNDFDQNGTIEQLICTYNGDKSYPMALRHDLVSQVPSLKKKYLKYENYKNQTITDIFSPEQLEGALKLEAYEFSTSILINDGKGKFTLKALPVEAQFAPVFGIELADFDMDGSTDILLGGNFYKSKPEVGRYDASYGLLLQGNGKGDFTSRSARESGIRIEGEVRDIISMRAGKETLILVARNNETIVTYKPNRK